VNLREFRKLRARASILLGYVIRANFSKDAWRIYFDWRDGKLSYREALERLRKLAAKRS